MHFTFTGLLNENVLIGAFEWRNNPTIDNLANSLASDYFCETDNNPDEISFRRIIFDEHLVTAVADICQIDRVVCHGAQYFSIKAIGLVLRNCHRLH